MNRKLHFQGALLLAGMAAALTPMAARSAPSEPGAVTVTVTAVGKKDAASRAVKKDDVQPYQGKERKQVADWRRGETLFLAVLIDDSLRSSIANQWTDLRVFLMAQPPTTYIAVAYARNGTAMVAQDFTEDHALAAKALRLPLGSGGAFTSPYLALQDWMKRWPESRERKSILLFSSGINYFRGGSGIADLDLDSTIERAQKENINIWTIYARDAGGGGGRSSFRTFNAQSNLTRLSEETGARSYYLGFGEPVNLKPYFDEIQMHLNNQYLLTFDGGDGGGKRKGRFDRFHVATELPNTKFLTPSAVFLPARRS
jgi:VWFA-related protein